MMFFKKSDNNNATDSRGRRSVKTTQVVANNRWIHRNQLEVGMYVNELDVPWESTRFMFQGFVIDSQELLLQVQDSCEYASVQTEKLALVSTKSASRLVSASR